MNEADVRRIVREEIDALERERNARGVAAYDQHRAAIDEITAPNENDGTFVTEMKSVLRGER